MSWDDNPYYKPEDYDATIVGEVEWSEPCWDFHTTVVWRENSTGLFRWGTDSGCSCPSPFEDIRWDELDRGSAHDVATALNERQDINYESDKYYSAPQVVELIARVMQMR